MINSSFISFIKPVNSFFISKNRNLTQTFSWSSVYAVAATRKGDVIKDKAGIFVSNNLEKNLKDAYDGIEKIVEIATMLLDATPIVPGVYDIIVHPSVTGLIAHEAFGHGVEMDMFVKKRAKSRLYIEKPVASPLVNMHDGASAAISNASFFFDDDGTCRSENGSVSRCGPRLHGTQPFRCACTLFHQKHCDPYRFHRSRGRRRSSRRSEDHRGSGSD